MIIDSNKIKVMLAQEELSMKAFCELHNIPYSTFFQVLNGTRIPNLKTIGIIANALNVNVTDLLTTDIDSENERGVEQ